MFGWGSKPEVPIYPELESPQTPEEFKALTEKKMKFVMDELASDSGWTEVSYNVDGHKEVKILSKPMAGESINLVKSFGPVNGSPEKCFSFYLGDLKNRQSVEQDLMEFKELQRIDENTTIEYSAFKSPSFPVSDREFTYVRHTVKNFDGKGGIVILMYSINYKDQPVIEKRVRGSLVVTGLVMQGVEGDANKTQFTRIFQLDPKGSIPTFVVNAVAKKAGDVVVNLRKAM
eukprot:TRINITY_DN11446_c0_g1_i1.p1 TRINITY_DN11446_c0_g1~~TRINITY_DN11446_c0_g1_i1.p1  ORF type:complete len:231 (-),score=50.06 TRINITY_DN11446_c0_g1_i1:28-720(-)